MPSSTSSLSREFTVGENDYLSNKGCISLDIYHPLLHQGAHLFKNIGISTYVDIDEKTFYILK